MSLPFPPSSSLAFAEDLHLPRLTNQNHHFVLRNHCQSRSTYFTTLRTCSTYFTTLRTRSTYFTTLRTIQSFFKVELIFAQSLPITILTETLAVCFQVSSRIFCRTIDKDRVKSDGQVTPSRGDL
jgi:hypothetical protein